MQIDFHHAVTYVVARIAGFSHFRAGKVAYCAQYVDDAINGGAIRFDNGAMYCRISSAHKSLDYRNSKGLKNRQVWLPFHFLPGNGGLPASEVPRGTFHKRLLCHPDSAVAHDMLVACIRDKGKPYALHRLGIAMHVYADTWAHQNFAGVNHKVNQAGNISSQDDGADIRLRDKLINFFISEAFPLGHGAVLTYPDRPYLRWEYKNGLGQRIERDNPKDFLDAADHMCMAMRRWLANDPDAQVAGLPEADKAKIGSLLKDLKTGNEEARHQAWLTEIEAGHFSFGPAKVAYAPKGRGSWKYKALGTLEWKDDPDDKPYPYRPNFLKSDWKMFHDALMAHRFGIIHDILPRYGICAA